MKYPDKMAWFILARRHTESARKAVCAALRTKASVMTAIYPTLRGG